jgi:hypothetical protein
MKTNALSFTPVRAAMLLALVGTMATGLPAEAAGKRAGVPKFEGAQEAVVRKQVMAVLKAHGYELAKSRQMEAAVQSSGALLESDDGFQKVAKELALTVIVTGEVGKKKAKLSVHDGREGSLLAQASFPGGNPRKIAADVRRGFWAKLGKDIAKGHVPSGSKTPQAVAEAPDEAESAPEPAEEGKSGEASAASDDKGSSDDEGSSRSSGKHSKAKEAGGDENAVVAEASTESSPPSAYPVLELSGSGAGVNRQYVYNQQISGLRNHNLPLGPALVVDGVWYPLGSVAPGPLEHLGVQVALEQAFGIQSSITGGQTYGNKVHEYEGGLRYRIPFGGNQAWISGSGGEHAFLFTGRTAGGLNVPDTIYRYARAGVGLRFAVTSGIDLGFGAGYRYIFNGAGEQFKDLFPHATVAGVDAEAALSFRVMEALQVRVIGEMRRYFSSMHSVAADQFKAGGAIDQYLSFGVGLTYTYGGTGGSTVASAEEESAPAPKKAESKDDDDDSGSKKDDSKKSAPADEDSGGDQ